MLAELGDGAKIRAGGQSLVPIMNFRLFRPDALVDVTRIPCLEYLRASPALGLAGSVGRLPLTPVRVQELATNGGGR